MNEKIDLSRYEGHTPGPWETNSEDSQGVWQEHDESIPRHIAMVHSDQNWEDMSETEFMRMMADKDLIADAPLLLEEVKRLRKELIELQEEHRLLGWKCATAVDWAEEIGFHWCEECRKAQHEWCESHDKCEHCQENKHHCGCAEFMESDEYKTMAAEFEEEHGFPPF